MSKSVTSILTTLVSRDVITEQQFCALRWYADRRENSLTDKSRSTHTFGDMTTSDPIFRNHHKRETLFAATSDVDLVRSQIRDEYLIMIDLVAVEGMALRNVARVIRRRAGVVLLMFREAAAELEASVSSQIDTKQYLRELTTAR